MRFFFTLIGILGSLTISAQEVPRQKVIVEVGTGTWCHACPTVVQIIEDLIAEGADIAVVEYHVGDPYENPDSEIRLAYYQFPWYPTTYYDSHHIGYDDWASYSVHKTAYETSISETSSFSLAAAEINLENNVLSGVINIDKVADFANENLKLHVVLTESNIPVVWFDETEIDYTERTMFPDGNGTAIDFTDASNMAVNFEIPMNASWVAENCELVFFIQDDETKQIVQGDAMPLNNLLATNDILSEKADSYFYPNPVKNELSLYTKDYSAVKQITISDLSGKIILKAESYERPINLTKLPAGVYIVSYLENNKKMSKKIIKE